MDDIDTADQSSYSTRAGDRPPTPGLIKVFENGHACFEPVAIDGRRPLTIGRGESCGLRLADTRASRLHVEIGFADDKWSIKDHESRNGTVLDGRWIEGTHEGHHDSVVVIGGTALLLKRDVQFFVGRAVELSDGVVIGPRLAPAWRAIRKAANGNVLHVTGETGTGKELAAKLFHHASARAQQPFVAVNCATIPPLLAERLLFGSRKGAYSGADAHSEGYLASAAGGTLFLDEIGELSLEVQAKLLRAVETHEVVPLGATRPIKVDIAICSATHESLSARIASGSFRKDLFFRLGRPQIELPPLRERREEIPWIVQSALAQAPSAVMHVSFIAEALTRPWPGNVRELLQEVHSAILDRSGGQVRGQHLAKQAGVELPAAVVTAPASRSANASADERALVLQALDKARGNVTRAAAELGWHRTQLRRWLVRNQIDPRRLGPS